MHTVNKMIGLCVKWGVFVLVPLYFTSTCMPFIFCICLLDYFFSNNEKWTDAFKNPEKLPNSVKI